jgi:hypothetical protein
MPPACDQGVRGIAVGKQGQGAPTPAGSVRRFRRSGPEATARGTPRRRRRRAISPPSPSGPRPRTPRPHRSTPQRRTGSGGRRPGSGCPPVDATRAFMAAMCSGRPWVGGCPLTSTTTSSVWSWANTPCQSARFQPLKSSSSMPWRLRVTSSSAMAEASFRGQSPSPVLHRKTAFRSLWVLDGLRRSRSFLPPRQAISAACRSAGVTVAGNDPLGVGRRAVWLLAVACRGRVVAVRAGCRHLV